MIDNLALVIDSTSKYSDAWPLYFGGLNNFFPDNIKKYLFTDKYWDVGCDNIQPVLYKNKDSYRNQFLNCLKQVNEKYIIYNSEDYILYNNTNIDEIEFLIDTLEINPYSFVKFIKGPEHTTPTDHPNIHIIDQSDVNLFAQQAALWKTKSLIDIFENSPPNNGRMQQEPGGSLICRKLGITGLQYHSGLETKRGIYHWDSEIYPCTATAISKGKWNLSEYQEILNPLLKKYKINPNIRGTI
jgi:hypothetical protein